jgi:hypothetical protein
MQAKGNPAPNCHAAADEINWLYGRAAGFARQGSKEEPRFYRDVDSLSARADQSDT